MNYTKSHTNIIFLYSKFLIFLCLFFVLILGGNFFNDCFAATQPASFMLIGVGARPLGMGRAFTALGDESSAVYWNPAGLNLLKKGEIGGMYGLLFENTAYSFVSYGQPFYTQNDDSETGSKIALGIGWLQIRSLEIEKTDATKSLGDTEMTNDAFFISGSIKPINYFPFYLGITGKRISQKIDTFSTGGFGVDLGMLIDGGVLKLGLNAQNIGKIQIKGDSYWGKGESTELIPYHIRSGLVLSVKNVFSSFINLLEDNSPGAEYSIYEPRISQDPQAVEAAEAGKLSSKEKNVPINLEMNIAFDFDFIPQTENPFKIYQGIEFWLDEMYGLRFSFLNGFSAGGSLRFEYFKLDYAFILHNKLGDTHRFSFAFLL